MKYQVNLPQDILNTRPNARLINGKTYNFEPSYSVNLEDSEWFIGDEVMIPRDPDYPLDAPRWIDSEHLVMVRCLDAEQYELFEVEGGEFVEDKPNHTFEVFGVQVELFDGHVRATRDGDSSIIDLSGPYPSGKSVGEPAELPGHPTVTHTIGEPVPPVEVRSSEEESSVYRVFGVMDKFDPSLPRDFDGPGPGDVGSRPGLFRKITGWIRRLWKGVNHG